MFDPTVFENLKVVAEGSIYDLDLTGTILVTNRRNIIDLASMGRTYSVSFSLRDAKCDIVATFILDADVRNLSGEILEDSSFVPGCDLQLQFSFSVPSPEQLAEQIEEQILSIWGKGRMIQQVISYEHKKEALSYSNTTTVLFEKTITEEHVEDLPVVVDYMVETLRQLQVLLTN